MSGEQGHCPHYISEFLVTVMGRPGTEGTFQTHPPTHMYIHTFTQGWLSHPADTQSDKFRIKSFPVFQFLVTEITLMIKLWHSKANSKDWNLFCRLISHDERRLGQLMKRNREVRASVLMRNREHELFVRWPALGSSALPTARSIECFINNRTHNVPYFLSIYSAKNSAKCFACTNLG